MKRTIVTISLIGILLSVWCVLALGVGVDLTSLTATQDYVAYTRVVDTLEEVTVPSSYNDDYRNLQYITPVKNQNPLGMCWTFAACAAAESDAIKNHGADPDVNLSEWHLGYFAYNAERDGTGDSVEYTYSGTAYYDIGGSSVIAAHTLATGIGFADESVAEYDDLVYAVRNSGNTTLDPSLRYQCEYYIDNVFYYDLPTQAEDVKRAILTYGAVATSYYSTSNNNYFSSTNSAFYCYDNHNENHAVTIVGWDDDYPKSNFPTAPASNGAWLIKNSWGTSWGLGGYFWISYEDKTMTSATAYDVVDSYEYDNRYQHDGGIISSYTGGSNTYYGNVFECAGNETLTAVSVETCETNSLTKVECSGKSYTLNIYTGTDNSLGLSKGSLAYTQSGTFGQVGMTTIKLTEGVAMNAGEKFFVCFYTTAYVGIDIDGSLQAYSGSTLITLANSNATVDKGQSYLSNNGSTWYDCQSYFNSGTLPVNFRIKAYTVDNNVGTPSVISAPTLSTINYGQKISASTINGGEVKDSLNGKAVAGEWSFENPDAICVGGDKVNLVFTPFKSVYSPIIVEVNADVDVSMPNIEFVEPIAAVYAGQVVEIKTKVTNFYDETLLYTGEVTYSYKIGNLGSWVQLDGSTMTIPTSATYGTTMFVRAKTAAVTGKYSANEGTTSVSIKVACQVQTLPTASALKYGQKLEDTVLTGGRVTDKYSGTELSGVWSVVIDSYSYADSTKNHRVKFVPDNTNYAPIYGEISVEVVAAEINITVTKNEKEWEVGKVASINIKLANAYNDTFGVETTTTIYYGVDGGEYVELAQPNFVVPQNAEGKKIKIKVVADAVENKYLQAVTEEKFEVKATVSTIPSTPEETEEPEEPSQDEPTTPSDENNGGDNSSSGSDGILGRLGEMIGFEGLAKSIPFIIVAIIVLVIIIAIVKKIKNR